MTWFITILLLLPASALAWVTWFRRPAKAEWNGYLARVGILVGIGLFAAGPFITTRSLGTSEAYNYGLAVADAVTQMREGVFPVLVGQSEFAFNGRIHPLRTAPYLTYFAGFLDLITFRQLNFWALQNLALAVSLMAGAFSCYVCLRRATTASPQTALTLTAAYLFSPGVLAAAYAMDLYMTVMAVPYVPIVVATNAAALSGQRRLWTYLALAAALAACWWCHPPIALWLTFATLLCQLALLVTGRIRWSETKALTCAAVIGVLLAGYVFVSALTVRSYGSMSAARAPEAVVKQVKEAFAASIRPISAEANKLGDFQLGYALWALLLGALVLAAIRRKFAPLVLLGVGVALLVFTIPVPGLTAWLWDKTPTFAITMNGPWPMQRVYLLLAAFVVFAAAGVGGMPKFDKLPKAARDLLVLIIVALSVWALYQGSRFVGRGYDSRTDAAYTRYSHYTENINPTLIAYAMFTLPPWFANGVMDPEMETRVLKRGTAEPIVSNWTAEEAWGREVQKGTLTPSGASEGDIAELTPRLKLEPGKRYRLEFNFRTPPLTGALRLLGANTLRVYPLPQSGEARSFGMQPSNNRVLTLWTSAKETEIVTVQLIGPGLGSARLLTFADFTLREYDPEKLPIRVDSWVPFRARVQTPEPGYIEIPRTFVNGYAAQVNGQEVRAQQSPERQVMAPVPAGESVVEISHPGPPVLRAAFWTSASGWAVTLLACGVLAISRPLRERAVRCSAKVQSALWRFKLPLAIGVLVTIGAAYGWNRWRAYADAAGPIRLKLVLPRGGVGRSQPLVTTGQPNKGAFIFVIYKDETHIQVGVDVWGQGIYRVSPPLEADYFAEHEFVISSGALYPPGHPKLDGIDPARLEKLRNQITVDFNGQRVLDEKLFSFDSDLKDVTIGVNRMFGSSTEPAFAGEILEAERLPIP
jgi:hypothetical protein